MSGALAVRTEGLGYRFGRLDRGWAVRHLDLEVPAGAVYGLLGPNGAGKSTVLRLLLGLLRPHEGRVEVLGHDPQAEPVAVKERVGYVAEALELYPWMMVLSLVGAETPGSASFSVFSWGWLGGALVGAALFTARERDGSRFLLYTLPIARRRLVAGRLLAGVAFGGLYLAECLLVFRAGGHVLLVNELPSAILMFVFFYGSAFLTGAALSPWLRSTVVAALLALISTYLLTMIFSWSGPWMDRLSGAWAGTGLLLAVLSAAAGWSTVRSRAFEPSPRKDLRALLTVLALWLAAAGILSIF